MQKLAHNLLAKRSTLLLISGALIFISPYASAAES